MEFFPQFTINTTIRVAFGLALALARLSLAVPLPQYSDNEIPPPEPISYMPGSRTRGTIELLWGCIITFFICIWTAIHTNLCISRSWLDRVTYKLIWMAGMALAPEFIIWTAVHQWWQARQIRNEWRSYFLRVSRQQRSDSMLPIGVEDWLGMPGAFFAVMGGFALTEPICPYLVPTASPSYCDAVEAVERMREDLAKNSPQKGLDSNNNRSTISEKARLIESTQDALPEYITTVRAGGFLQLLRDGVFLELVKSGKLNERNINSRILADKGKADSVSKFLVCMQVSWFLVQGVGRRASKLSTSLLELHVIIQVVYAIIVYFFWWSKPLDASEPIYLEIPKNYDLRFEINPAYYTNFFLTETIPTGWSNSVRMFFQSMYDIGEMMGPGLPPDPFSKTSDHNDMNAELFPVQGTATLDNSEKESEARTRVIGRDLKPRRIPTVGFGVSFSTALAFVNGGVHLFAWNSHFPSPQERLLWIISCFLAGGVPFILFLMVVGSRYEKSAIFSLLLCRYFPDWRELFGNNMARVRRVHYRFVEDGDQPGWVRARPALHYNVFYIMWLCILVYLVSLLYITVGAFISIRSLPPDAYTNVPWSDYWPHL